MIKVECKTKAIELIQNRSNKDYSWW